MNSPNSSRSGANNDGLIELSPVSFLIKCHLMSLAPITTCLLLSLILMSCVPARPVTPHDTRSVTVDPPSTLLPPGTTRLTLVVKSESPSECRYALQPSIPFEHMSAFAIGGRTTHHVIMLHGLSSDPSTVTRVFIRCDTAPEVELEAKYRILSQPSPSFPRTGNLWGSWNVIKQGLDYASRIDLWLGSHWRPDELRELRRLNPHMVALASINAVEPLREAPSEYFLKDVHGHRIEVWPGDFRLNLTKPEVAKFQAQYAYEQLLKSDLMYDGVFIDNVFLSQSWLKQDIFGKPVQIDANEDGVEDNPMELDAAWRAGILHELRTIRTLLPHAILSGHGMDIRDPEIAAIFNATSIGFDAPCVIEGRKRFAELWNRYTSWQQTARPPGTTMVESAVPMQIGYGYGYSPIGVIPPSTLEFARQYYPYMRFGLTFTLMHDGYFAHELGDTFHGNDWWYDELDFDLGHPLGPAEFVKSLRTAPAPGAKDLVVTEPCPSGETNHGFSDKRPALLRREFTNGLALLNATTFPQTVTVGPGFARLTGQQAALHEYIVDDSPLVFSTTGDWKEVVYDSGEWKATGPYYHDWGPGSHEGKGGTAQWDIRIPEPDTYTITAWWPAAPSANAWNTKATYEIVSDGRVVAFATFDQRSGGDEWHFIGQVPLKPGASVRLRCDESAPCLADALHVRSQKRYNDGSPVDTVTLQPMDGIILKRVR